MERIGEIVVKGRYPVVQRDGRADQINRDFVAAGLMRENAE
jgi:hypothetical protein